MLQSGFTAHAVKVRAGAGYRIEMHAFKTLRHHQLACRQTREFCLQRSQRHRHQLKITRRNVGRRHANRVTNGGQRHQHVRCPTVEQTIFGERSCSNKTHDVPRHQCLGAAPRLCRFRTFGLLGNCDAVTAFDQPREIAFGTVHRHPAHRDWPSIIFTARSERDIERCRCRARIVKEQLEKIAHPVEQQAIARLGLQCQILHHHRCRCAAVFAVPRHRHPR